MATKESAALQTAATDRGTDPVDALEFTEDTGKRATHEALELTPGEGNVDVTNASHAEPEAHTYRVDVLDGVPVRCECPADEYHEGACKHRLKVALAPAVIDAATPEVRADGGQVVEADARPEDCECWAGESSLPCFECHLAGFDEPNPDAPADEEDV